MDTYVKKTSSRHVNPFKEDEEDEQPSQLPVVNEAAMAFVRQLATDLQQGEFDLPPFPDTALRIQQCIQDPASDNRSLAAVVATEPALAARLMRMANSALMRRGPIEITDIPTAISRVGLTMVQNAAMSYAAREAFQPPPGTACFSELNALRRTSVKVAAIAYVVAREVRSLRKPDEAMLAGLLGSVGKFYIYTRAAQHAELFSDRKALDRLIAQWHTGVARAIVESWELPEIVAHAVDEQEVKERDRIGAADLSDVLLIANIIARAGIKAAGHLGDLDSLARLRMDASTLQATLQAAEEDIQSMVSAMS